MPHSWGDICCAASILLLACVAILWVSEHERGIKLFFHDLMTCLRCINRGEDL